MANAAVLQVSIVGNMRGLIHEITALCDISAIALIYIICFQEKVHRNDAKALFLSEQLQCLGKKRHKWSEATIL